VTILHTWFCLNNNVPPSIEAEYKKYLVVAELALGEIALCEIS
jgi:hypothetical protein